MRVAIYARVSTERQEREQTIESQLNLLRTWADGQGYALSDEHMYTDEGYSGSRLDRPGLDRLRDAASEGAFQCVAVLTPDRLARKYAYQVLLLEELSRAGCQVVFVQHPISEDPNDQLLLQIQGAVAEYERALLGERFRRGKLQKAKSGQVVAGKAPYGYRYVHKQDGTPGHLVIEETEAGLVRMLYGWLIDEQMTIRQILKRLNFGPWYPRSGKHPWSPSVVHHILADPIYTGTAYANRYRYVPAKKPRATRGPRTGENSCRQLKPRDEWIPIPVPAIIDAATYERAQGQLARNAQLSYRHNTKYNYLLRCLLTCSTCQLAMFGVTYKATTTRPERTYYKCHGHDCILSARDHACPRRSIPAEALENAVWNHIRQQLENPAQLLAQFAEFAQLADAGTEQEQRQNRQLQAALDRLQRQESRLVDAYQAEVISLDELSQRRHELALRRQGLLDQQRQQAQLHQQQHRAQEVLESLTTFCAHIQNRLDHLTFAEKQVLLQLLIERIIVGEDSLEIRHVIPLHGVAFSGEGPPEVELRSDGVHPAPLPARTLQHGRNRLLEPLVRIADHQLHASQAASKQAAQKQQPELPIFARPDVKTQHFTLARSLDARSDHHRNRHDAAILTHLDKRGIQPHVRVAAFQPPIAKTLHFAVKRLTQARYLALRDALHAQRLDQLIHAPSRDTLHVGFLNHRRQRLFRTAPRR